jgi:hypothetical protein
MKEIFMENPNVVEEDENRLFDEKRMRRWTLALYVSVTAGIISAFSGLVLGAVSYLGVFAQAAGSVNQIGNLLIIAAFPLLMLGAHALDKISEIKTAQKQL